MPLDTQTFALSRWWAQCGLDLIQKNENIFSSSSLRQARREFIAGKNQVSAIKNWLLTAQIILKKGGQFELSRIGRIIFENDKELRKSSTWWAFHLMVSLGEDPFPYNAFFLSLDTTVKQFSSLTTIKKFLVNHGVDKPLSSIETYLDGVLKMFREDGPLQGLGLLEKKESKQAGLPQETYYRLSSPIIPDAAIVFAISLAQRQYFKNRPSVDFGELIEIGLDHYLALSQDELKRRISIISHDTTWRDEISFSDVANITSISFGERFNTERMLIALLQEGGDSWM